MKIGDLVKSKYSIDKSIGVILETRKIGNSLAIKIWSPYKEKMKWHPSKGYEVING
jgi:hypothetical protein